MQRSLMKLSRILCCPIQKIILTYATQQMKISFVTRVYNSISGKMFQHGLASCLAAESVTFLKFLNHNFVWSRAKFFSNLVRYSQGQCMLNSWTLWRFVNGLARCFLVFEHFEVFRMISVSYFSVSKCWRNYVAWQW